MDMYLFRHVNKNFYWARVMHFQSAFHFLLNIKTSCAICVNRP